MGVSGFDRKQEEIFASVCVAPFYIKNGKKINANSDFVAADAAIAA